MKFGAIQPELLDQHEFTLPKDHSKTELTLVKGIADLKVYTGCAKWGRPEWVGMLYPEGTKDKDFLSHYVNHFNAIEMNTTFYSINRDHVKSWMARAPEGFKFSPKFNRIISHIRRLNDEAYDYLNYFLDAISGFETNLGASFLQVPENFGIKNLDRVEKFVNSIPDDLSLFIEFRHESWFDDKEVMNDVFQMLSEHGIGVVITDVATRRDGLHQYLTIPKAFIRFNGYGLHNSDYQRLDAWVDRIKSWSEQGLEEVYFYCHQGNEAHTPKTADYFLEKINKKLGLNLRRPQFIS